jgi:flavin-dependent dehydrogenase
MRDVIVIGGGLAGCSAARQLAGRGLDVLLLEKGSYPRHKLCGEFLSPEVRRSFRRLGVADAVREAGAHTIDTARLTAPGGQDTRHPLPDAALGLSRYRLDALLFDRARAAGADARTGARVREVRGSLADGFAVSTADETHAARVVLGAYGKQGVLDRTLDRSFRDAPSNTVAFKAHYRPVGPEAALPGSIEMHAVPGGYCGCSHVEEGRVNVCWIATTDALKAAGGRPDDMVERALPQNPALAERLDGLERVSERFEAVSQVCLAPRTCFERDVCMIGDTAGMIAPLCGNGMAMALRAADLAVPLAAGFVEGRHDADAFRSGYRKVWRSEFGTRMAVGRRIHAAAFRPGLAGWLVRACRWVPGLARTLIRTTRGH